MRFLPVSHLEVGMVLGKSIVSRNDDFMLAKGVVLTENYIAYLNDKGYQGAYIEDELSAGIDVQETIKPETMAKGVDAVAKNDVEGIVNLSSGLVSEITSHDAISVDLFDLRSYDDYTYRHSVNVAVYAVAVGKEMGLSDKDLVNLAVAGLCHDLGKSQIPIEIINKPGQLTDEEFQIIKSHPRASFSILFDKPFVDAAVRQAVVMHHENENGTGYPLGKTGDEIPLLAKIIHAVDVYDALTSRRPYKEPYSRVKAYDYMQGGINSMFSSDVVSAMTRVIPLYPPGVDIWLSNKEEAIVVKNSGNPNRPIIRIKETMKDVNLATDQDYKDVTIVDSGLSTRDFSGQVEALNERRSSVVTIKKKILLVDKTKMSLIQTQKAIGPEYDYIMMDNSLEAVNYVRQNGAPDLMIIEIDMPTMSGITAARNLRKSGFNGLPIIFMSERADLKTVLKTKEVGAKDYIVRPASPTYIHQRVAAALSGEIRY